MTGMSVVDNQYVFVRGLGERYSNTTLAGAVIPTTEPDKKVVPLDLFPAGLIDSVQVAKSYSPDKSAEFAGGLVQIVPLKLPNRPVMDFSYGDQLLLDGDRQETSSSARLNGRDWWGYDDGARALPSSIPDNKIVRRGIYTPDVGYTPERDHGVRTRARERVAPTEADGAPGQNWSVSAATGSASWASSPARRTRTRSSTSKRTAGSSASSRSGATRTGSHQRLRTCRRAPRRRSSASSATSPISSRRITGLGIENFYTHSGRDEGRFFEGDNFDNCFATGTTGCSSSRKA